MSVGSSLPAEELNRFSNFIFFLPEDKRDFLLGFLQAQAPDFFTTLSSSLPRLNEIKELATRNLQDLLRATSFNTLGWALHGKPADLVETCGENMSNRARVMLKEEIEKIQGYRKRAGQEQPMDREEFENMKEYKTLLFRLRLQKRQESEGAENKK